jgi:3-dehydroquinate dehydratase / shikimate dehydrogenase
VILTKPLLVETVTGRDMAELRAARDAVRHADLVELRLDGVEDIDVDGALDGREHPVIVTCRPRWEGGRFDGSEEARRRILTRAFERGAEYVDIEAEAGFDDLVRARGGARVVLSMHDFGGIPSDLLDRVRAMRAAGAEIVKVAITAHGLSDCVPLRDCAREGGAVVIAMGDAGIATRILAARFGSCWTYAGDAIAPGQVPASRMVGEFRFRQLGPGTAVYGVVGSPIVDSLLPAMHNAAFAAAGIDAVFLPLQAKNFADFEIFAAALGVAGASVTTPFTRDALAAAARADDAARQAGAANTLRRAADGWEAAHIDRALVAQAERQFEYWFGRPAPQGVMAAHVAGRPMNPTVGADR